MENEDEKIRQLVERSIESINEAGIVDDKVVLEDTSYVKRPEGPFDSLALVALLAEQTGKPEETYTKLITFVPDRPGHDRRYALDSTALSHATGWSAIRSMSPLVNTLDWYVL